MLDECHRRELDFNQAVEAGVFTTIGEGCLDFPAFFARAAANGYRGWCVVEQDIKFGVSPVAPKESMGCQLEVFARGGVTGELAGLGSPANPSGSSDKNSSATRSGLEHDALMALKFLLRHQPGCTQVV